jgi:hypothetical protein
VYSAGYFDTCPGVAVIHNTRSVDFCDFNDGQIFIESCIMACDL